MKITIITNAGCGFCTAAMKIASTTEFQNWCGETGTQTQEAKYSSAKGKAALKLFGIKGALKVPLMLLSNDDGSRITWFSYRPAVRSRTAASLIAAIESKCGGGCAPSTGQTRKTCPTCKGVGSVLAALALTCFCGCVLTAGSAKPVATAANPNPPNVRIFRFAILYPFEVADVTVSPTGQFGMGAYKTSGGAAELVPLFDSAGKVIGSVIGSAANAAVAP